MKKVLLAAAIAASTLPMAAQADTILGIYASAGIWNQDFGGQFQGSEPGDDRIDMEDDFGFGEERGNTFSLALEHPIPVIPNARISRTELSQTANNSTTIDFEGERYTGNVTSSVDLDFDDYLLYYEILDGLGWMHLDIGINARHFDGGISVSGNVCTPVCTARSESEELKGWIPMLYGRADFNLPFTGLTIGGEAMGINVGDASLRDVRVRVAYESSIGLGIEVGQRNFTIDYDTGDSGDVIADLAFSGTYAAATYHF